MRAGTMNAAGYQRVLAELLALMSRRASCAPALKRSVALAEEGRTPHAFMLHGAARDPGKACTQHCATGIPAIVWLTQGPHAIARSWAHCWPHAMYVVAHVRVHTLCQVMERPHASWRAKFAFSSACASVVFQHEATRVQRTASQEV